MRTGQLDWDKLRVFKAVADLGSMNAAASKLSESSPTISRKVDELERLLNARLFDRSTRGVLLTQAGRTALRHVNVMYDAAEAIYLEVSDHDRPIEGPISIATGDGLGPYWIAPRIPKFHLENSKVELQLDIVEHSPDIVAGEADIAITYRKPDRHDTIGRSLGTLHYMFFASREYINTYGEPRSLFEMHDHRCIFHQNYVEQIENWAPKSAELRQIIDFALLTNSGTAIVQSCANGGGVAVMPSYIALMDTRLVPLDLPEIAPIQFWLTYTERVRRLARGQLVLDWIRSLFDPQTVPWFRSGFIHPNRLDEDLSLLDSTPCL
ncbi:MAG: LysR family transcriptional regulator [Pseudomonadota bacterium]